KHRDWLMAAKQRQDDWVVSIRGDVNARVVLSARRGVLLHLEAHEEKDATDGRPQRPSFPEVAIVLSPEEILYANGSLPNKFGILSPATNNSLTLNLKLKSLNNPEKPDQKFSLMLHAGMNHSADQKTGPLIKFNVGIDPAFALSNA